MPSENEITIQRLEKQMAEISASYEHIKGMGAILRERIEELEKQIEAPIAMRLTCEDCGELHVDEGDFATKPHHTHACQYCGMVWRPAVHATVGVRFLPGFKNEAAK